MSVWVCACLRVYIAHKIAVIFLTVSVSGIDVCTFGEHGVVLTVSRAVVLLPNVVFIEKMCHKKCTWAYILRIVYFNACTLHDFVALNTAGVLQFMTLIIRTWCVWFFHPRLRARVYYAAR